MEKCLEKKKSVDQVLSIVENFLSLLSDSVLNDQSLIRRRKIESLVGFYACLYLDLTWFRSPSLSIKEIFVVNW